MSRQPDEILRDALAHFEIVLAYAEHDLDDQIVIDAICMRLSAGVEALATLEPNVRDRLFGADWPLMWGHAQPDRPRLPARRYRHRPPDTCAGRPNDHRTHPGPDHFVVARQDQSARTTTHRTSTAQPQRPRQRRR